MWFANPIPSVPVSEAYEKSQDDNVTLIDVRTPTEYTSGHAAGARNYPLEQLNSAQADTLRKYTAVYVICRSGGRSASAVTKLRAVDVPAINVAGGTIAWQSEGLPMG